MRKLIDRRLLQETKIVEGLIELRLKQIKKASKQTSLTLTTSARYSNFSLRIDQLLKP